MSGGKSVIVQDLILQNFGPYRDRQSIHLAPESNSPIILIGGLNGGGKTTLMDAIRLALYGQRAQCSSRSNLAYAEFLNQCRNRYSDQPTYLELRLHVPLSPATTEPAIAPQLSELWICRTWSHLPKNGRDTLEVYLNGERSHDLTTGWDERIERLLPLGISNLFLFDGEQVKDLAEDLTLPPLVISAIRNLLGLELPDRLSADLDVLITRKRKDLAAQHEVKKLDEIEQILATQESERKVAHQACAHLRPLLERAQNALNMAQEQFISEGGQIAAEKAQVDLQLTQAETEQANHQQHLRDLASSALPLNMVRSLLTQAQAQGHRELQQQKFESAKELIQKQQSELLQFIQDKKFPKTRIQQLQAFLQSQRDRFTQPSAAAWITINQQQLHSLTHTLEHQLPDQLRDAQKTLKALSDNQIQIDALERYRATAAAPERYQQLTQQVRDAQAEATALEAEFNQATRYHEQTKQAIERTKKELSAYGQSVIDVKNTDHLLRSAQKVQQTLDCYKQRLKRHKFNRLEHLITECFLYLLHKSNLVHRVQIDTDRFALSLYNQAGEPIPKHRLSAGEKQLLAIALLWGLARASGRRLPVAIDTPLGRLDSKHRKNLVERYFPQASHQVILLSTDTEIRDQEVKMLRKQGAIAREYVLEYDPKQKQTEVKEGYFES